MDGLLNIHKEAGMTSHDVVNKIRRLFNIKKVGHTGTLDPNATGVLVVALGQGTKVIPYLENSDKEYIVKMKLGLATDTEDIWGNVIEEKSVNLKKSQIEEAITSFIGKIEQVPPMYSAIKVNGKKLYELARAGIEIERKPRNIEIFNISDISINNNEAEFRVNCSKGTYIRTLCKDIGLRLNCPAVMSGLIRSSAGSFKIESSTYVMDINKDKLIKIEEVLSFLPAIKLLDSDVKKYLNGISINIDKLCGKYRIYNNDNFLGVGRVLDNLLKIEKYISD